MNNKKINKSAFTMVEVLTTSVISTIILLFLYVFLNHILTNIRESENMVK
jgi:prepilin-type N-terminal cleavage/methylation domain-containing protein